MFDKMPLPTCRQSRRWTFHKLKHVQAQWKGLRLVLPKLTPLKVLRLDFHCGHKYDTLPPLCFTALTALDSLHLNLPTAFRGKQLHSNTFGGCISRRRCAAAGDTSVRHAIDTAICCVMPCPLLCVLAA